MKKRAKQRNNLLLAVDIGNTTISLGLLQKDKVVRTFDVEQSLSEKTIVKKLRTFLLGFKKEHSDLIGALICSVVPKRTFLVSWIIKDIFGATAQVVGKDIIVPIKNNYRDPKQVGQDRLVCAYAAKCLYGAPAVVIDFGTATTFDLINSRGEYEGGLIVPGLRLSAETLFQKTALLPKIAEFKSPRSLIGKDTKESILSGLFFGYGAMSNGLIGLIAKRLGVLKPKVIVTGGYISLMRKFIDKNIDIIDKDLVFKGLALLSVDLRSSTPIK